MDWQDYLDFDLDDVVRIGGDSVADAIQDLVESTIEPLIDQLEFAQSDAERELAQAELDSFRVGIDEAETIAEEFELDYLTEYMSQAYKYDQDLIDRYVELVGEGFSGGGSGGGGFGGGGSTPSPPDEDDELEQLRKVLDEIAGEEEEEEFIEDYSFWDYEWEEELVEQISNFFDFFF